MNDHWEIISSRRLSASGELISTAAFRPSGWYPASVPGTVLGSLVKDSVYRDIFYDRNLEKIPDSLFAAPWWYRTRFSLGKFLAGQVTRLVFNGINYRAEIWLNGHRVARDDTTRGGFSRFILDVSGWVQPGENVLAVRIARRVSLGPGDTREVVFTPRRIMRKPASATSAR